MASKNSGIGLGGYMASYGYDDETLQNLKEQAQQDYVSFQEDQTRKDQIAKFTNPLAQTAAGFALDIPGMVGFEDYSYGPGIIDAINIKKRRYRENGKLKIDREVLGATEGLEEFLTYEPKQNPNLSGRYQDLLTGKYYDDEGNLTGVEKELRDYVRDVARDGRAYKVGEVSMYMLDAYGLPALLKSLPGIYKAASPYVKRIMQGSGLLALTAASTDAEAKAVIKGFNAAVKTGSKFDALPASVQKKIEGTALETLGGGRKGKKNLTQEQKDNVVKLKTENPNISTKEIVELTGVGKSSVGEILRKAGLTVDDRFTPDEIANIIELRKQGLSIKEIAEQTGRKSTAGISQIMKDNKLRDVDIKVTKMNEAAKNFDPNKQSTWKDSLLVVKDSTGPKETRRFLFPDNPEVKETIVKFINEKVRSGTRGSGVTVTELSEILGLPKNGLSTAIKNFAKDTDLIKKYVKSTNTGDYSTGLRSQLERIWRAQNPEEAKKLNLLKKQVKQLNDELGLTGYNRFEVDHIRSIIDDYHITGAPDFGIKNVQIIPKFVNQGGFQRNGKNLIDLPEYSSKFKIFENSKFGIRKLYKDLQKPGITAKEKEQIHKAIKQQWNTWSEIVDDHEVLFDFTDYKGKLPDEYLIKNKPDDFDAFEQLYDLADDLIGQRSSQISQEYLDTLLAGGGKVERKDNKFAEPAGQVGVSAKQRDDDVNKRKGVFAQYLDFKDDKAETQLGLESMPESQQKQMAFFLADPIEGQQRIERERVADASVRYKVIPKEDSISSVQQKIAEKMIDKKPTKFPLTSFPKLLTENALVKSFQRNMATGPLIFGQAANSILNSMGGDEKTFAERFPVLNGYLTQGFEPTPATPKEAAYIDGIDEINRAVETGFRNLGFNTMDLVLGGIDLTGFGDGKLSERLRENYEKTAKNDPETFMGDMVALLVEFGVPGGLVTKLVTRLQKAMRIKGFNTMTRYVDDDVVGATRLAMNTSNIAKRMGTGAVIFGAADFVGGGPYSSLKRMFPEDATLLPGKPIDTTDLSGPELALANMKNRVRFGADGALIGGLFPLVGPPAWALTKGTLALPFKTLPGVNRSVFGGALQLAGVPLKIAADSLAGKIPYTNKTIPLVGEGISYLGKQGATAAQATAAFIGKQVFTRAALGLYDLAYARSGIYSGMRPKTTMFTKNLPKFEDWRRFSVNSRDPLHQYLAKIDNKLAMFRDIGKLGKDAFATKTQSDLYIRAKSRAVEKYLIDVERIAYKLAKAFEERHQKYGEFETIQKKYLDDVLDFLEGKIRVDQLPKQLQVPANDLRNYTNSLKKEFGELLPTTDPINYLLQADINAVMRRSFAAFTNNSYQPTKEAVRNAKEFIKDLIQNNNSLKMEAEMAFPDKSIAEAIDEFASLKVADIMHTARYEMSDPFKALENIAFRKLGLDDISLVTGDELPKAIRALLGEEKNLRSSLLQTTGNIIASTSQKKALDQIAQMGLANGWLFRSADEALGKGILNAAPLTDVKGSGFLLNDAIGLYGTPEIIKQLGGYSLFDGFLKSTIYQNILAAKAMVQGGKTLYSPATQMRNVGSAALFALNVGHIGGSASVPQAFKIVMDDIFGPGRNVDKKALNKFIERKIELGVIDENVVAQELTAILNDLKGATKETGEPVISSFNQLIQRVGNTQLSQYVQRLYAGGDNLWKLYGHEFYISELKQFTKSIDDVQRYFKDIVGREFVEISPKTGGKKTVMEGIEEIAAHLVRDTYPTYSRVPPAIQAIRKLPIGNFISFPAEMLRTTATTLSTSLKHIASGNPGLQAMGYRSLFGQFSTLYGVNEGVKALGHTFTDVSPEAMRAYQDGLGPKFMENHLMVPLTNKDPQTGEFKAFDLSSYNPYAYVIDPVESFIRELGTTRMSVDEVEGEVYNRIFDAASPLMAFIEPFTSETILLEPMFDIWARQGRARNGATVFSPTDDFGDKVSKSFRHIIGTVAPGFIRSGGQVLNALSLDTKQGRLSELGDVMLRLMGGSIINVDPVSALDYKAIDIRDIRSNVYKTEHFFSKENALERGPDVMAAEFQQIQNEALAAQFEVYKMFAESLESGLLTRDQIEQVLGKDGRNVPNLDNLMDGYFTPVSYSESGLEQRADELYKEYLKSGIVINRSDLLPLSKLDSIIFKMENIRFKDLVDPDRKPLAKPKSSPDSLYFGGQQQEPVTPDLPNMPTPVVPNTDMNPVNPATGLTTTETALLSPGEQAIRQRQKGMA